jgi:hypothetical protein
MTGKRSVDLGRFDVFAGADWGFLGLWHVCRREEVRRKGNGLCGGAYEVEKMSVWVICGDSAGEEEVNENYGCLEKKNVYAGKESDSVALGWL